MRKERKLRRTGAAKRFYRTCRRLLSACSPYRLSLVVAVFCALGSAALTIFTPLQLAELTDLFVADPTREVNAHAFGEIALRLILLYVAAAVFSVLGKWLMSGLAQHVSHHLRHSISKKINRLPTQACENTVTGDLLSRVTNDMDVVGHAMHEVLAELPPALALFIGSLFLMLLTNVTLAVVAVTASLVGVGLMLYIMKHSQEHFVRQQKALGALSAMVEECYTGQETIAVSNAQEAFEARFVRLNRKLERSTFRSRFMAGLMVPLMSFAVNLGYLAVCVAGAALVLHDQISFGVIVAFMFLVHHFTHPFSEIAAVMQALQSAVAAGERVFGFLDAAEMPKRETPQLLSCAVRGAVEFDHISFRYPDTTHDVIHDFSLCVAPGQKVAIVGPSGAGKSTLARLLGGFYLPREGEIRIDGVPTHALSQKEMHRLFAPVFRNAWVFEGTVRENLIYCAENADEAEMLAACRAVGLDHFIRTLPRGYDTVLSGEVVFSQGQRQQLELARALLSKHPMLILDEATGAIDPRAEQQIGKAIDKLTKGRTTFVIAHRVSTIENADIVLVMQEGRLADQGTHRELIARNAFYAALYHSQKS